MPVFTYKVRDQSGRILQGKMDAVDGKELRRKLDERNLFVIEFTARKSKTEILFKDVFNTGGSVNLMELSIFSWQLFTMLDAGLTLLNSLRTIIRQTKNERFRNVLTMVTQKVEAGASFSDALKEHPKTFSRFYVQMINAGEVGGVLDEMLKRLAAYYERQSEIRAKIKGAAVYPALLLIISIGVIIFLVTVVLPQFAVIFKDIGADIPLPTAFLLKLSMVVRAYWLPVVMILAGTILAFRLYVMTDRGRYEFDELKLRLPLIGNLVRMSVTTRFTQTLSTLVSGGIPILTALDVVTETIGNTVVAKVLRQVQISVGEGKPIAQTLEDSRTFDEMVVNMIRVGEETGSLEKMLDKIAYFYNREVTGTIDGFTKIIEPLLMVVMAGIIGFIAVSIFLPMANLLQNVR